MTGYQLTATLFTKIFVYFLLSVILSIITLVVENGEEIVHTVLQITTANSQLEAFVVVPL